MNESPLERPTQALDHFLDPDGEFDYNQEQLTSAARIVVESLLDDADLVNVIAGADILWHSGGVQIPLDAYIVSHLRRYWLGGEEVTK